MLNTTQFLQNQERQRAEERKAQLRRCCELITKAEIGPGLSVPEQHELDGMGLTSQQITEYAALVRRRKSLAMTAATRDAARRAYQEAVDQLKREDVEWQPKLAAHNQRVGTFRTQHDNGIRDEARAASAASELEALEAEHSEFFGGPSLEMIRRRRDIKQTIYGGTAELPLEQIMLNPQAHGDPTNFDVADAAMHALWRQMYANPNKRYRYLLPDGDRLRAVCSRDAIGNDECVQPSVSFDWFVFLLAPGQEQAELDALKKDCEKQWSKNRRDQRQDLGVGTRIVGSSDRGVQFIEQTVTREVAGAAK